MCGIAGSVNFSFDASLVNQVMGHRGPDAQSFFQEDNIRLHHLRLSIVDISFGQQPMHYLDRYTIIFNGEIYNHKEIRKQLGLVCRTGSDTETLLHAWHKEGPAMLDRIDGMFAFALYDNLRKQLTLVRDRAGKKPLYYYYNQNGQFVFASELNALNALLSLEVDNDNISAYLRIGSCFGSQTPYKNVSELSGGCMLVIDTAPSLSIKMERWWTISSFYLQPTQQITEAEALEKLDSLLNKAVKRRIESSDLEVGTFLSGGIDSGLITAIASGQRERLKTFTVSFEGMYNEAPMARLVAEKYKTDHNQISIDLGHLVNDIEKIIGQYGEPFFDNSAIPSWYVCRAASEHLTVILNGDGADELFGGYRRHVPFSKYNFFNPSVVVRHLASFLTNAFTPGHEKQSKYTYFYRLLSLASKKGFSTYLASWTDIFEGFEQHIIADTQLYMREPEELFSKVTNQNISGLKQIMWLDFDVSLFGALLPKMDIASMAHSLEGRSPMLSKELLEWVPTLPDNLKIKGKTTKYLLRILAKQYLPSELVDLPKKGFEVPIKSWVNSTLKDLIASYLLSSSAYYPLIIEKKFVMDLLDYKIKVSDEKRAKMLWSLFCIEVWYNKCVKNNCQVV